MKTKVYSMTSPAGNPVANQFEIYTDKGRFFQSYRSTIAQVNRKGKIILDDYYWDYSRTTSKYRNLFLGMTTKEIKEGIKSGEIKLKNLN